MDQQNVSPNVSDKVQVSDKVSKLDDTVTSVWSILSDLCFVNGIVLCAIGVHMLIPLSGLIWLSIAALLFLGGLGLKFFEKKQNLPKETHLKNMIINLSNRVSKLEQ